MSLKYTYWRRRIAYRDYKGAEALEQREKDRIIFLCEASKLLLHTIECCLECSFLVN